MKKIAITGPECTGKTTLARALAQRLRSTWVPEYARTYLENIDRPYRQEDLLLIAQGQIKLEDKLSKSEEHLLICDTDITVIKIWQQYKYGSCYPQLLDFIKDRHYDLFILTAPDIPWVYDPQREQPDKRDELYTLYKKELEARKVNYKEVSGTLEERVQQVIKELDKLS